MSDRPRAFDTGYHMMYSLLDGVTPQQIKEEIPRIEQKIRDINSQVSDLEQVKRVKQSKLNVLKELIQREDDKNLRENFVMTQAHKKIIQAINWEAENPYEYMRVQDVCELLKWKKPNDDYSDEQYEKALKLLKEVPIAVARIFEDKDGSE